MLPEKWASSVSLAGEFLSQFRERLTDPLWLLAKFSRLCVEIGVPCIERFFLSSKIALEIRLTFGNDAPTAGIFVEKDSRYLCAVTIAENGFVRGHEHVLFLPNGFPGASQHGAFISHCSMATRE